MKILSVDELIKACNKEELFKMNYEYTNFEKELQDKEIASELDSFLDFYEWSITKYQMENITSKMNNVIHLILKKIQH